MRGRSFTPLLLFTVTLGVMYLVYITRIGYLNDDWYLMYAAQSHGAQSFFDIYKVDRPARALVLTPAYQLFGDAVLYYNLSALVFRLVAALSFGWILKQLWPHAPTAGRLAALLFFVYPGFLSQFNGIDYQSQLVSLAAAICSLALSLRAFTTPGMLSKTLLLIPAVLLGWFYLSLVEYFLGFELFRLAIFILLKSRSRQAWLTKALAGIKAWLPNIIIPGVFLVWRVFFFESERGATDIGAQLVTFKESPLATGVWWTLRLLLNSLDVIFSAWVIPLYQLSGELTRLREVFSAALASVVVVVTALWSIRHEPDGHTTENTSWQTEALWLGTVIAVAGLAPVILVNRAADFTNFTRYTLASSAGSALVITAILLSLSSPSLRGAGLTLILLSATFTHHANALKLANETQTLRDFWWQVAWRIPMIEEGTALIANYPVGSIQEDYFVWGPANMIYYPDGNKRDQIRTPLTAIVLNQDAVLTILSNKPQDFGNRRSIQTIVNYNKILILTKPSHTSCVQVLDGGQLAFSEFEEERVMLVASNSNPAYIVTTTTVRKPPDTVFGAEPSHDWCYFYETASLALQQGNWAEVVRLGESAFDNDFAARDHIEWLPFLRAYARFNNIERLQEIKQQMQSANLYTFEQICPILLNEPGLADPTRDFVHLKFCPDPE